MAIELAFFRSFLGLPHGQHPRSPPPRQEPPYPPPKKGRTGRRSSLRSGPRRKGKKGGVDDSKTCAVDIRNLLYSQKSCKVGLPWAAGSGELGSFTSKRHWNFTKNSTGCWLLNMKVGCCEYSKVLAEK